MLLSGEVSDAIFFAKSHEEAEELRATLEKDSNVRKVFYNQDINVLIGDLHVINNTVEDFSLFEGAMLYEGLYPRHDNEICISGSLALLLDVSVGDQVTVSQGSKQAKYLVVGLIQSVNNNGVLSTMTVDGFCRLQTDFEPQSMYVYLTDDEKTAGFVNDISAEYGTSLHTSINMQELVDVQLVFYGPIFFLVALVLLMVAILVIFLVLFVVLKTVILRRRREFGIQKALGFTTLQLMNQLALYFLPVLIVGIGLGGILGSLGFNPMFVAVTRSMGIMTASMPVPLGLTVVVCALLVVVSYLFALLIAFRIRKISAYALVTE
jgi:putative ABC transport system permease protein